MKVFLSYSSKDNFVISSVAKRLGRSYIVYDEYSFDAGVEFDAAIVRGLDDSDLFVLFASKHSMASEWVSKELQSASALKVTGKIDRIIVIIIDDLELAAIPDWLRRAKVIRLNAVMAIVREIKFQLQQVLSRRQAPYFVGRQAEMEEVEGVLSPTDTFEEPHVFAFFGLEGVGRKTLCSQVCSNLLSLPKSALFRIQDGDRLPEIVIKLQEDINPSSSMDAAQNRIAELEKTGNPELLRLFVDLAKTFSSSRELLILQDDGGLLDNDGYIYPDFQQMIAATQQDEEIRISLVTRRKPIFSTSDIAFPCIGVRPLRLGDTKRLLLRRFRDAKIAISDEEIEDLAPYVGGYPPAVNLIVEISRSRGVQHLIADKGQLVEFTAGYMLKLLERYGQLTDEQTKILVLLAYYSPLPLEVMGRVIDLAPEDLTKEMNYLFDCAFVIPDGRLYRLADPLVNAVVRSYGRNWAEHSRVVDALESYLGELEDDDARVILARSLFRAVNYSGRPADKANTVAFVSDLIDLSQYYYHERRYEESITFCRAALEKRPNNIDVRAYLARSLVQLERYTEAQREIEEIKRLGFLRDHWFLKGFLDRKRNLYPQAIESYLQSLNLGRTGVSIHRELAQCYYEVGEYKKALSHIAEANKRDKDNRYVVDLEIQIAVKAGDRSTAEKKLNILRIVDDERFYFHRSSTVNYRFGELDAAYNDAKRAMATMQRPPFAFLSQMIKCEIATARLPAAEIHLAEMDRNFRTHHDIRTGLRCKFEIAKGDYDAAIGLWERLREKERPVHLALLYLALNGKMSDEGTLDEKLKAKYELLQRKLASFDIGLLDLELGADRSD